MIRSPRVVVAEDEAIIRLDIVETLTEAGFDCVGQAGDGQEAIRLALELKPDLVLMDIKMPGTDGLMAAEALREHKIPVVLLTAFSSPDLIDRASEAGVYNYVVKPFNPSNLIPALRIALSLQERILRQEAEIEEVNEKLETRKLVERAKALLTEQMQLNEPEAFRWIQKASMDRRLTMKQVAQTVIEQLGSN
ncbi:MAG: response regulator [Micrococcales bacterium]|nr:response regulator [Micrococcales bacterium]NBR54572.1 response regulator [Micrococcales bacterium]NBR60566.1 response regulator [Actinomycetota bacterium]NBT46325.1 response regulator [Actinomycetota bacterium]